MTREPSIDKLRTELRKIFDLRPDDPESAIEAFLDDEFKDLEPAARIRVLEQMESTFSPAGAGTPEAPAPDTSGGAGDDAMDRLAPLLQGMGISTSDIDTPELFNRLADSLNTIFNMLNELIHLINATLGGGSVGEETIRHIIGGSLESDGRVQSIEEYLGQIKKAFLTAQQSSKDAAHTIAGQILTELDPATMESSIKGFKIGPMKKAEAFELFEEKYKRVRKWFDSDRFLLDFLRQFEKNCQKSYT